MSKITGTVSITGILSKKDTEDAYPLVDQKDIKGGYRVVSDESERESISPNYLEDGMIVHVLDTGKEYIYKNTVWEEYFGSPDAVEVHIGTEEPTQEHIKVWIDDTSATPTEIVNIAEIDDENISLGSTWSSSKISGELADVATINDTDMPSLTETWSSVKISNELDNNKLIKETLNITFSKVLGTTISISNAKIEKYGIVCCLSLTASSLTEVSGLTQYEYRFETDESIKFLSSTRFNFPIVDDLGEVIGLVDYRSSGLITVTILKSTTANGRVTCTYFS